MTAATPPNPSTPPTAGVSSEVGRLRTVMLHRPGPELQRLTPRNNDKLLFDGIPWVTRAQEEHDAFPEALRACGVEGLSLTGFLVAPWGTRAQEEHDAFAEALRARGVEVLYLTELLVETLASAAARHHPIQGVTAS